MNDTLHRDFDVLRKVGLWLLAVQIAVLVGLYAAEGIDGASRGYPTFVMCTGLFVAGQRRLAATPPNASAAPWILGSHVVALAMLALGTLTVAVFRFVPDARPAPAFVPRLLFALMWIMISLKGAAMGKLKPVSAAGACPCSTGGSRLAWDRAHRAQGRVLFWGGLGGLALDVAVNPFTSIALWFGTVVVAALAGAIEGWRTRRLDHDRPGGQPA